MGLLSSLFGKNKPQPPAEDRWRGPGVLVRVAFRELTQPSPGQDWGGTYTYVWSIRPAPEIGSRAFVRGHDDRLAAVVVTDFGMPQDLDRLTPSKILRAATTKELAQAQQAAEQAAADAANAEHIWLDMMRRQAGLPTTVQPLPNRAPTGFPEIPPATGTARNPDRADSHGKAWWRAHKQAEHPSDSARFRELALHWFRVRDRIVDPERAAADDARTAREAERQRAGVVRGRFFAEWAEDVQQLKREQRLEEAHDLLVECIAATWRADGNRPASWPFEQAAIVLRKLKRPEDEVAVLSAYVNGSAEPSAKLVERFAKLTDLT